MVYLKDICVKASSSIAQKDLEGHEGQYPIYGAAGYIMDVDFYHQDKPYVAIVKDGAGVGRVMCLPAFSSVIGTLQYIIPTSDTNVHYLAYALEHMNLAKYYTGATIPHIYFKDYCMEKLPRHSWQEQQSIATRLSNVDTLIALRKQQMAKLDELVKARFVEMFGDPVADGKQDTEVPLGSLAEIGSSKRIFEKEYVSDGVPFYRTKEIVELSKGNGITTELFISNERYAEIRSEYGVPQKGDLLISAVGTIGVIWIVDGERDFYFKDGNLLRVSASKAFEPVYLKYLLETLIGAHKSKMSSGTAYAALTISMLKEMPVIEVPLSLQHQFAAFVAQTDQQKLTIQHSLAQLELLKKALMQKYFG